jgi:hypothetical protein
MKTYLAVALIAWPVYIITGPVITLAGLLLLAALVIRSGRRQSARMRRES